MESSRIQKVQKPVIPVIGQWIKANPGTISLGQGVVHYGPPKEAIHCMTKHLSDPHFHKYKLAEGIDPLLRLIEDKLAKENNIRIEPSKNGAFVTAGANMAFYNLLFAIADPGDEIILLTPYYFNYEMAIEIAGCKTVSVHTDDNFQPDIDAIEKAITPRTKAIVTISPNNPTGVMYAKKILTEINSLCRDNKIYHISDEAYEYFTYNDVKHFSPGSIKDSESYTISIYSLSKAYGMASWRIGYVVLPKHLEMAFKKIQDTNVICAPVVSQYAAVGAMQVGAEYCKGYLSSLKEVRKLVLDKLRGLGNKISFSHPDGALYVFIRINDTNLTSIELVKKLIFEYKVALVPGSIFGIDDGCYVRLSYGSLEKKTAEGIGRFLEGIVVLP